MLAAVGRGRPTDAWKRSSTTLLDAVDAVADLLLAESVHQVVRGNPDRAAAALDTLNRGEGAMAEPEVVATPGPGPLDHAAVARRHRRPTPRPLPAGPPTGCARQAEPRVAAWAGHLLGDPSGLAVTVRRTAAPATNVQLIDVPLSDLGLGALDLVYEPLAPRVLRHAADWAPPRTRRWTSASRLATMLAVAGALRELLNRARAGTGLDLARPQDRGGDVVRVRRPAALAAAPAR